MGCFSAPKYEAPDPGEDARSYLEAISDPALQKKLFESRSTYDPLYAEMEMDNIRNVMMGTDGEGGLLDLLGVASEKSFDLEQQQLGEQREADVSALLEFAPQIVEGYREADPYSAQTADNQRELANQAYERAQGVTPQQQRMAEQQARTAGMSRGRGFGQGTMAAEILGREEFQRANRAEAMQMGQTAFGMDRSMAGDLGSIILGRPSSSVGMGGQMLGQATGLAPGMGSGNLFDLGAGINYGLGVNANQNQFNSANYGAKMGMYGGVAQGLGNMFSFGGG